MALAKIRPSQDAAEPSFEDALCNLEQIVHDLEEGDLALADAMNRYEEGVTLLKQCHGLLECAERKIELLSGIDASGNPIVRSFDDEASMALQEKGQTRNRRRTAEPNDRNTQSPDVDASRELF